LLNKRRAIEDARTILECAHERHRLDWEGHASSCPPCGRGAGAIGNNDIEPYGAECRAFTADMRRVDWPTNFQPDIPEKYFNNINLKEFLQIYTMAIQLRGTAWSWPMSLPPGSVGS